MGGYLIISLDFELCWGVRDHRTISDYGENILGGRDAIKQILSLFLKYGIHATFATVGLLFFSEKHVLMNNLPLLKPNYKDPRLTPYGATMESLGESETEDPYHFGASLIREILATPGQEIGSHTFSHYYCMEEGQTLEQFSADLDQAIGVAKAWGISPKSIVFPRNQWRQEHLDVCHRKGLLAYRGTETNWIYWPRKRRDDNMLFRGLRLLDSYINIGGHQVYPPPVCSSGCLVNLPASRFLRPWSRRLAWLEKLRLHRIKKSMTVAAEQGKVFHLWWHPHNFGKNTEQNLIFLESVLKCYKALEERLQFRSVNMGYWVEN